MLMMREGGYLGGYLYFFPGGHAPCFGLVHEEMELPDSIITPGAMQQPPLKLNARYPGAQSCGEALAH